LIRPASDYNPIAQLLNDLLHAHAFEKWLALATGLKPSALPRQHALARRFRAGLDYALANTYKGKHLDESLDRLISQKHSVAR